MINMIRSSLVSIIILLVQFIPLHAADWPQWGGTASRNMVSQEKGLPSNFARDEQSAQDGKNPNAMDGRMLWTARIGNFACGTPAVANGKVFVGGRVDKSGVMNCYDAATGKLLWQWIEPCRSDLKEDAMNFRIFPKSLGVCSTPAIDGDRLYFVDHNCMVQCLDINGEHPADGAEAGKAKVIWSFDMYADPAVHCRPSDACNGSPLIEGNLVYVTTANGVDRIITIPIKEDAARRCFAPDAPTLIVLNKLTGKFLARDTAPTAMNMLHGQWSSPSMGTVDGRTLVFLGGGDGNCYAFEALTEVPDEPVTLKTAWWVDCNPPEYRSFNGMDMITHYTLGDRRRGDSINKIDDGSFVGMSEIIATPVFYRDRVYVAIGRDPDHGRGRGALLCLDASQSGDSTKTGILWWYKGLDRSLSTVSIDDGLLYIADVGGRVHCLDAEKGDVHWVYESKVRTIASTLVADGKVYLPSEKHLNILAVGKELKFLGQVRLDGQSWVTPVAANGTLYIVSKNKLWAVGSEARGQ